MLTAEQTTRLKERWKRGFRTKGSPTWSYNAHEKHGRLGIQGTLYTRGSWQRSKNEARNIEPMVGQVVMHYDDMPRRDQCGYYADVYCDNTFYPCVIKLHNHGTNRFYSAYVDIQSECFILDMDNYDCKEEALKGAYQLAERDAECSREADEQYYIENLKDETKSELSDARKAVMKAIQDWRDAHKPLELCEQAKDYVRRLLEDVGELKQKLLRIDSKPWEFLPNH